VAAATCSPSWGETKLPVHDWTRVEADIFHDFHVAWVAEIRKALNGGLLPDRFYALVEQHVGRTLAVRHVSGHRLIAILEILSPANKDRASTVENFAAKVVEALDLGVHVLVVDLFPPGPHDPHGIHGVIRQRLVQSNEPYDLPAEAPLTLASYASAKSVEIYVDHIAVGAELSEMPLFLHFDRYIPTPLETTYREAYRGMPAFWRGVLESNSPIA
jgi:hypothetical protein